MKKKILTLDDLYQFCKQQKLQRFSSQEDGKKLYVHLPAEFDVDESNDDDVTLFANVLVFHTGRNRNGSNVTEEAAKNALTNLAYKPLLANFCEDENGVRDFTSHDMEIDDEGNIVYLERQVGCFTADEPFMRPDENTEGRINVFGRVAIPREYTDTAEIIERKGGSKVSVELAINEMEYDSEKDELILSNVEIMGCTLLGKNPETGEAVQEGMEGAHVQLEDFAQKTKYEVDNEFVEVIKGLINQAVNEIKNTGKEDETMALEENNIQLENEESVEDSNVVFNDDATKCEMEFSITVDGVAHNFKRSTEDEIRALDYLVNATYCEADGDYYMVYVYPEDKQVVMCGWSGSIYRQGYDLIDNNYQLVGERVTVTPVYITADEEAKYNEIKNNYDSNVEELEKYKEEPEKIAKIESDEYAMIKETSEYAELCKRENYFNMTLSEITAKLDELLLASAKTADFSANNNKEVVVNNRKAINTQKPVKKNYGSLLDF